MEVDPQFRKLEDWLDQLRVALQPFAGKAVHLSDEELKSMRPDTLIRCYTSPQELLAARGALK